MDRENNQIKPKTHVITNKDITQKSNIRQTEEENLIHSHQNKRLCKCNFKYHGEANLSKNSSGERNEPENEKITKPIIKSRK